MTEAAAPAEHEPSAPVTLGLLLMDGLCLGALSSLCSLLRTQACGAGASSFRRAVPVCVASASFAGVGIHILVAWSVALGDCGVWQLAGGG